MRDLFSNLDNASCLSRYFSVSDLFSNLDNAQMREQHLLLLLSGALPWIDPPDVISKEIEEGKSGRSAVQHSCPV